MTTPANSITPEVLEYIESPGASWAFPPVLPPGGRTAFLDADYDSATSKLNATLRIKPSQSEYVPSALFVRENRDDGNYYSLSLPLQEHDTFLLILGGTMNDLSVAFGADEYDAPEFENFSTAISLIATGRAWISSAEVWADGYDCETCGWNIDEAHGVIVLIDDKPIYCELNTRWGCYGGISRKEEGTAGQELWDAFCAILSEGISNSARLQAVVDLAYEGDRQ